MRLSPRSVFFGLVSFGLPIAVTVGWVLGETEEKPVAERAPAGAGAFGTAPEQPHTSKPLTAVEWSTPATTAPRAAGTTTPSVAVTSGAVPPTPSPPILSLPPVPTPTMVTSEPPSPSATPSSSSEGGLPGVGGGRLVRRP